MIEYALKEASKLTGHKYKIYAVVTDKKGRIVGESANSYKKTHPLQKKYAHMLSTVCERNKHRIYLHAEIGALVKARGRGHNIYIARAGRTGKPLLAKPCPVCEIAIEDAGITNIYYTE